MIILPRKFILTEDWLGYEKGEVFVFFSFKEFDSDTKDQCLVKYSSLFNKTSLEINSFYITRVLERFAIPLDWGIEIDI